LQELGKRDYQHARLHAPRTAVSKYSASRHLNSQVSTRCDELTAVRTLASSNRQSPRKTVISKQESISASIFDVKATPSIFRSNKSRLSNPRLVIESNGLEDNLALYMHQTIKTVSGPVEGSLHDVLKKSVTQLSNQRVP